LGGHIELMDIAARLDEPAYAERFTLRGYGAPNTVTLVVAAALGGWVSALTLSKLMLAWYVVATPLSFLGFCVAFGRSRWLAFFAFPLTWNHTLNFGFLNFLVGMPLLFGVAAAARFGLGERRPCGPWNGWLVGAMVGLLALYFCHFMVWMMALAYCVYVFALFGVRADWLRRLWWVLAPSLLVAALWVANQRAVTEPPDPAWKALNKTRFKPLEGMLLDLHHAGLSTLQRSPDDVVAILLLLAWLWLMIWRAPLTAAAQGWRAHAAEVAVELSAFLGLGLYFLLPENFGGVNVVAVRVLPVVALLLVASHRLRPLDWRLAPALITAVAAALTHPLFIARQFNRYEAEVLGGLPAAIGALPRGVDLRFHDETCTDWGKNDPVMKLCVNFHVPRAIHTDLNGGLTSLSFAGALTAAIIWRPGQAIPPPSTARPDAAPAYTLLRARDEPTQYTALDYVTVLYGADGWWLMRLDPPAPSPDASP
jgi:hypothetical protein